MSFFEAIIRPFAPHHCLGCGAEGSLLCPWCMHEAQYLVPSRCINCHKVTRHYEVCSTCRKTIRLGHVWVATEYTGLAKELVRKLKFERATEAAERIADLMDGALPFFEDMIVTHVPTASSRRRQRGYDQAELIAKKLAKKWSLPYKVLLIRQGQSRQVGAARAARFRQLKGVFYATNEDIFAGKRVLLIDDVVTTGATIAEAARVLRQSGAKTVNAAVFAQKM